MKCIKKQETTTEKKGKAQIHNQLSISVISVYEAETVIFGMAVIVFGLWQTH